MTRSKSIITVFILILEMESLCFERHHKAMNITAISKIIHQVVTMHVIIKENKIINRNTATMKKIVLTNVLVLENASFNFKPPYVNL